MTQQNNGSSEFSVEALMNCHADETEANNRRTRIKDILHAFEVERRRSMELHGELPGDLIHGTSIMVEEAGEALRAALNHRYHGESIDELKTEVIQTGAMCLKLLLQLEETNENRKM